MPRPSAKRFPSRPDAFVVPLVSAFLAFALSGCTTLSGAASSVPLPGASRTGAVQAAIIAEMNGGLIGGAIGEDLDGDEKARALEAEYRALEYTPAGEKVAWSGETPARRGEVVAAQPYRVGTQDCRQYKQTVFTEAGSQIARGAACRNPDGSWTPLT